MTFVVNVWLCEEKKMDITCNEDQRLFVFKHTDHVSCMGYDVVYKTILELERRIRKFSFLPKGVSLVPARESEIGTLDQYQHYQDLLNIVGSRKIGTWFSYDTPTKVRAILEQYRKDGGRLRLFYGDRTTGRDWLEENDLLGKIGRSTGSMQIPLLIAKGECGGPGILDDCIVRIVNADSREEIYRQKNYFLPDMEIRPVDDMMAHWHVSEPPKRLAAMGYTHGVWVREKDGEFANHANFRSYGKAAQFVAFMAGECCEQPE